MKSIVLPLLLIATPLATTTASAATRAPKPASACQVTLTPRDDLQAAVDRLPQDATPATVCLAKGEYDLRGLLAIQRDHTTLKGVGHDTLLRMRDGVQQPLIVIGDWHNAVPARRIRDVTIANLQLVGGSADKEFMPERPYLSNSAVVVRGGDDIHLTGLKASHCRSACLLSEQDTRGFTLDHNDVSGAIWDGVSFNRTSKVTMRDNYVHDNVAAGITTENLEDSEISNNRLERNGSQGVYLSDARRNRFVANQFTGNKAAGVFLACSIRYRTPEVLCWDNSMSQDNTFEDNVFSANPFTYTIGVDRAANCKTPGFTPNLWRNNRADASGVDIEPARYGYCMRHAE